MEHFLEGQLRALSTSKPKDSQAEKTASRSSCILPGGGDSSRHQYCIEKLANLTIELAKNGLKSKILPSAMEASNNGIVSNDERGRGNEHLFRVTNLIIDDLALATSPRIFIRRTKENILH